MNSNEPYNAAYQKICSVCEHRIHTIEDLLGIFRSFVDAGKRFLERLGSIKEDHHYKNIGGGKFVFVPKCAKWIEKYLINIESIYTLIARLEGEITKPFGVYQDHYRDQYNHLKEQVVAATAEYQRQTNIYIEAHKQYFDACETLDRQMTAGESIDDIEGRKNKCVELERNAIAKCEVLGSAKREFAAIMESVLVNFEQMERKFFGEIRTTTNSFVKILHELGDQYKTLGSNAQTEISQVTEDINIPVSFDSEKFAGGANQPPDLQLPVLDIDIFSYLPWDVVFSDEIHKTEFYQSKTSYLSQSNDDLAMKTNDVVAVLKTSGNTLHVENQSTFMRGSISKNLLKPCAVPIQRYPGRLKGDFKGKIKTIAKDQFVYVIGVEGDQCRCKTAEGLIEIIPKDFISKVE